MATLSEINSAEAFRQFPLSVYLSILGLVGLIGNTIVFYIYTKVYTNSNSRCFIRYLSVIDLMTSIVAVPVEIFTVLNQYEFRNPVACGISRFLNSAGTVSASTILILIAIDRYRKICKPLKWQISNRIASILSVCSVLFGVCFSVPNVFLYGVRTREVVFEGYQYNGTECSVSDDWSQSLFPLIFNIITLLMFLISACTLVILYSVIGKHVRFFAKRQEERKNSSVFLDTHSIGQSAVKRRISEMRSQECISTDSVSCQRKHQTSPCPQDLDLLRKSQTKESSDALVTSIELDFKDEVESVHVHLPENGGNSEKSQQIVTNDGATNSLDPKTYSLKNGMKCAEEHSNHSSTCISKISSLKTQFSSILSTQRRKDSRDVIQQKKKLAKSTTYLMFIISMVFILNFVPYLLLVLLRELKSDFVDNLQENDGARTAYRFFLRSYFANCAVNPIIYSIFDRRFRQACKQTLRSVIRKCCPRKL